MECQASWWLRPEFSELSFGSWVTVNKRVDAGVAERMFGTCFDTGMNQAKFAVI